jgi:hypothetical protein
MPYKIVKYKGGYRVCSRDRRPVESGNVQFKCFSKNPMTKIKAKRQLKYLEAYEENKKSLRRRSKRLSPKKKGRGV